MEDYTRLLLEETQTQLIELHSVIGQRLLDVPNYSFQASGMSLPGADYIIQIEVAVQFVYKALKTEDRLDIFKALQKAYDTLKLRFGHGDADYDLLVEKLKQALERLQEEVFVNKSVLKPLIKFVIKEIQEEVEEHSSFVNISEGHKHSHEVLIAMINDIKLMVEAYLKKNKLVVNGASDLFLNHRESLLQFLDYWAQKIYEKAPERKDDVERVMNELRGHFKEISRQGNNAITNIRDYENYINALNELEHLNEIFDVTRESVDELFKIGLDSGFGKKEI